jgi:tetratricopeptide (TPR) repeat protein
MTPAAAMVAIENGQRLAAAGQFDEATDALESVLRDAEPALAAKASWQLGVLLFEHGDRAEAKQYFLRTIDSEDPDTRPRGWNGLGVVLIAEDDIEGAKSAFEAAIETGHPDVAPKAARNLGIVLLRAGRLDEAETVLSRAIQSGHPEEAPRAETYLARVFALRDRTDQAKAAYEHAFNSAIDEVTRRLAAEGLAELGFETPADGARDSAREGFESTEVGPPGISPLDEVIALANEDEAPAVLERFLDAKIYALGSPAGDVSGGHGTESDVLHFEDEDESVLVPVFTQPRLMRTALLRNPEWQMYSVLVIAGRGLYEGLDESVRIVINPWTRLQFELARPKESHPGTTASAQ